MDPELMAEPEADAACRRDHFAPVSAAPADSPSKPGESKWEVS